MKNDSSRGRGKSIEEHIRVTRAMHRRYDAPVAPASVTRISLDAEMAS